MNDSNSSVREISSRISDTKPISIKVGKIMRVYPDTLTADVYINKLSSTITSIPISFASRGTGYGSYFMPKEGSACMVISTDNEIRYVLASSAVNQIIDVHGESEKLMAGENMLQGINGAFIKQDKLGNHFLFSNFGNSLISSNNGINSLYANGSQENTISKKIISGFGFDNALFQNDLLKENNLKVIDYSEYYSGININRLYTYEDIIIPGETLIINQTIKDNIISQTNILIEKINGTNGFKEQMRTFKSQIQDSSLTEQQLSDLITNIFTELDTNFSISKKGVKIIIEKGNALNKSIDNINDVSRLKTTDFDLSSHGEDICLRLMIKDVDTDEIKAQMSVDVEGNCNVKFKTLKIEVGTGGYELIEG